MLNNRKYKLENSKIHKLFVQSHLGKGIYLCLCDCGMLKKIRGGDLIRNKVISCGCYKKNKLIEKNSTHKLKKHRLYRIYHNMISRCYNPNTPQYKSYGARNITISEEWLNEINGFMNFYNWAISNGYDAKLTLDRINNDGNYESSNCRWTTNEIQCNNKQNNIIIKINNKLKTLQEWCNTFNINYKTVRDRIKRGWTIIDALSIPVDTKFKRKDKLL